MPDVTSKISGAMIVTVLNSTYHLKALKQKGLILLRSCHPESKEKKKTGLGESQKFREQSLSTYLFSRKFARGGNETRDPALTAQANQAGQKLSKKKKKKQVNQGGRQLELGTVNKVFLVHIHNKIIKSVLPHINDFQ